MTVHEAAALLEVSPDLVYRLCRAGRLAHSRIGLGRGVIRIERADVEELRQSSRVEAGEPGRKKGGPRRKAPAGPEVEDIIGQYRREKEARKRPRALASRPPEDGQPHG